MGIENLSPLIMTDAEARYETILDMREELTNFETLQLEELFQQFDRKRERNEIDEV